MRRAAILCAAALIAFVPCAPQAQPARPAPQQKPVEAPPEPPPTPYDRDLFALAEVIGTLAFLRGLCGDADASEWPTRMAALLETEGSTQARRARLAGAYNKGFRDFSLTYRICTEHARAASERFAKRGEQLSRAIAARFGG